MQSAIGGTELSTDIFFPISFFVQSLSNSSWTRWALRVCFIDCLRSRMIVFRAEKEFSHFAVEAPRVTSSFSAKFTVGIALSTSHYSKKSWIVVSFVFSSSLNFATYVLETSNSASTLRRSTKFKRSCNTFVSEKLLFPG